MIPLLVKYGADVNRLNQRGYTSDLLGSDS